MERLNNLNQVSKGGVRNFEQLNFREVNIWKGKIAWTFFMVDLNEDYPQLWSKEYPSSFFVKTESGNVYKIFRPNFGELYAMTWGNQEACKEALSWPTERCIFNPRTRKIIGVENSIIRCGESFAYAPKCTTSKVKEIVGVSSSQMWFEGGLGFSSTIEQEFNQLNKMDRSR